MNKKVLAITLCVFFMLTAGANALTTHEIRAHKNDSDHWSLRSLPEKIYKDNDFINFNKTGVYTNIHIARLDNAWDENLFITGHFLQLNKADLTRAINIVKKVMRFFDEKLPNEKSVAITYWVDFGEISIIFYSDRWQDGAFHKKAAELFNKFREEEK